MNSENQQIPMNERFAFDDICVFGYFVSAYFCISVQDSYFCCMQLNQCFKNVFCLKKVSPLKTNSHMPIGNQSQSSQSQSSKANVEDYFFSKCFPIKENLVALNS